jgi:hypothetical protein
MVVVPIQLTGSAEMRTTGRGKDKVVSVTSTAAISFRSLEGHWFLIMFASRK